MRLKSVIDKVMPEIINAPKEPEFPVGLSRVDSILWGYKRKEVTIIAGRTSQGKSAFSLFSAYHLAKIGKKVGYFSLEMSEEAVAIRIISAYSRTDNEKILKGLLSEHEIEGLEVIISEFKDVDLTLRDEMGVKWQDIEAYIVTEKPDIIFIDYVQMVSSINRHEQERLIYATFTINSKSMAKKYDIPIVLVSQINRQAVEDTKYPDIPQLHHLKGSGVLEENPDVVIILHWYWKYNIKAKDQYSKNDYAVYVAKNRNGRTGVARIFFEPEYYWFHE